MTIRTYGALSTTFRKRAGWIAAPPVSEPPRAAFLPAAPPAPPALQGPKQHRPRDDDTDASRVRRYRWARLIARTWLQDPSLCPSWQAAFPGRIPDAVAAQHRLDDVVLGARGDGRAHLHPHSTWNLEVGEARIAWTTSGEPASPPTTRHLDLLAAPCLPTEWRSSGRRPGYPGARRSEKLRLQPPWL